MSFAQAEYQSEAAFQRAFKKYVGTPLGAWRKARLAPRNPSAELAPA